MKPQLMETNVLSYFQITLLMLAYELFLKNRDSKSDAVKSVTLGTVKKDSPKNALGILSPWK